MRSLLLETKFQKMCRCSGSGSPLRMISAPGLNTINWSFVKLPV